MARPILPDPDLIVRADGSTDIERGRAGMRLLEKGATAIFCYNDITAIGLLIAARQRGVEVPQQLSIVGFDNIEPTLYVDPPLTTVAQPLLDLGREAMVMTLDLLECHQVQDRILPCELLIRQSTAPPN